MDKSKQIQKIDRLSLKKLSEDSKLVKRGLRDLSIWPKVEELFAKLKAAYENGQIDECVKIAEEILQTDSNHFFTLCYYGRCLYQKDEYEKSAEYLTRCLNEEENYFFLWKFRGDCYYKMKDYKRAIIDYKKSLDLDPTNGATLDHDYIDDAIKIENESDVPMIRKAQFFEFQQGKIEALNQYKRTLEKFRNSEYATKKIVELSK